MRSLILLFLTAVLLLFSCTSKEEKEKKIVEQHEKMAEQEKGKKIEQLVSKYNIAYKWDTLHYAYAIEYDTVLNSKYQLVESYEITDIYRRDSLYFMAIRIDFDKSFYFDFPILKEQVKELLLNRDNHFILVVSIEKVRRLRLSLEAEPGDNDPTFPESASIDFDNGDYFIGKGKIVEMALSPNN